MLNYFNVGLLTLHFINVLLFDVGFLHIAPLNVALFNVRVRVDVAFLHIALFLALHKLILHNLKYVRYYRCTILMFHVALFEFTLFIIALLTVALSNVAVC